MHRALDTAGAVAGPVVASLILSQNATGYRSVFVCSFFASCIGLGVLVFFVRNKREAAADAERRSTDRLGPTPDASPAAPRCARPSPCCATVGSPPCWSWPWCWPSSCPATPCST